MDSREIAGGYCLDRVLDGDHYNLTGCWTHPFKLRGRTDNGPLDGTVAKVGWNRRYILAWRRALVSNESDGWMLLDTKEDRLDRILTDEALAQVLERSPELRNIVVRDVNEAWPLLADARRLTSE
jgi:hypothetical protein